MRHLPIMSVFSAAILIAGSGAISQDRTSTKTTAVEGSVESRDESPEKRNPSDNEIMEAPDLESGEQSSWEAVFGFGLIMLFCLIVVSPVIFLLLLGLAKRGPERRFWARKSGWSALAERYRTDEPCPEGSLKWQAIGFGNPILGKTARLSLGNGICVTVNHEWVDIRMGAVARAYAAHKSFVPLRIPLSEIELLEINPKSLRTPTVVVRILGFVFQFYGKSAQAVGTQLTRRNMSAGDSGPPPLPNKEQSNP